MAKVHTQAAAMHHHGDSLCFMAMYNPAQRSLRALVEFGTVLRTRGCPLGIVPMSRPRCGISHEIGQPLPFPSSVAALAQV